MSDLERAYEHAVKLRNKLDAASLAATSTNALTLREMADAADDLVSRISNLLLQHRS